MGLEDLALNRQKPILVQPLSMRQHLSSDLGSKKTETRFWWPRFGFQVSPIVHFNNKIRHIQLLHDLANLSNRLFNLETFTLPVNTMPSSYPSKIKNAICVTRRRLGPVLQSIQVVLRGRRPTSAGGVPTSPTSPKPQVQTLLNLPVQIKIKHILTITLPRITSSPAFSVSEPEIVSPSTVEQGQGFLDLEDELLVREAGGRIGAHGDSFPMTGRTPPSRSASSSSCSAAIGGGADAKCPKPSFDCWDWEWDCEREWDPDEDLAVVPPPAPALGRFSSANPPLP
ncbi:uncharacterized protein LACBIDRAFT_295615 [Laccaria bicolor S238N-H82]|uniref:Predicted protein n=1 Tax=Laccaria bicolor (strain S238N-H82 / ATCC MYA-4686) TaxID=486041 RepID=B0DVY7_LACBS|nr:uncharacterized protein LACBIDRAFT_295615 [Laccaria bicolor S238N-H82]EDR01253.1 predicted protein [Laccaria bicolor S238N-H82]|eukprot:XP_001888129.1 predicted protein [Laccaria bicolor S238N-H82]